jgi:hypothetical protein
MVLEYELDEKRKEILRMCMAFYTCESDRYTRQKRIWNT